MEPNVLPPGTTEIVQTLQDRALALWQLVYQPWTLYQIGILAVCYVIARLAARWLTPLLEERIRQIKGHPGLLRMLAALLRKIHWIAFIPLVWLSKQAVLSVTWPSRTYFLSVALTLALAWLVISILSRIIRNRTLARLVAITGWTILALYALGLVEETVSALDSLALTFGEFRLSVLQIIQGLALLAALTWLANAAGNYADRTINRNEDLTPSLKVLLGKVIKIALVIAAIVVALSGIGIDLTAFTVFSGAVGVGLGFGLQKVVSNFISGIIILLDKSIKPGDTISLGDTFGWIRELRARYVSVVTRDGKEYLIPNEDLVTQQVVNWSFTDNLIRLDVPFGVSYESDPHEVIRLAKESCVEVDRVTASPAPVCWMTEFGDSSINFLLRFWIADPQQGLTNIRGKVLLALWDTFKENGISIPFPHREVIVRAPVEVEMKAPSKPGRDGGKRS